MCNQAKKKNHGVLRTLNRGVLLRPYAVRPVSLRVRPGRWGDPGGAATRIDLSCRLKDGQVWDGIRPDIRREGLCFLKPYLSPICRCPAGRL